ncbi:hypothetical protein ABIB40_003650 [Pedobacter sp. UYP30]|uniref:hypothetical protein n=1 Tax=Pedobacter sp. UYP30 TaxID=1756400 RepID=UPI00339A8391
MKSIVYTFLFLSGLLFQLSCGTAPAQTESRTKIVKTTDSSKNKSAAPVNKISDLLLFKQAFAKFKQAIKEKNKQKIMDCFNFPLQTAPQWSEEELKAMPNAVRGQSMQEKEFASYYKDVFTPEVMKLIINSTDSEAGKIDPTTNDPYYSSLYTQADKGSSLYEIQKQYPQDNGQETSFGFVFGKISDKYKIVSYYRPWPLK